MNAIETTNLTKKFGKNTAVSGLNLTVLEGEIFGFVGPCDAGKSTTIRMLLQFLFPSGGKGKIFGLDVVRQSKRIKTLTGYVPKNAQFHPHFTPLDILGQVAAFHRLTGAKARIAEMIDLFHIAPHKKIEGLSPGAKKRVALAAGLLPDPKLLLLDEATAGIDPMIGHRLFDVLAQKNRRGTTIFLASQNLAEVEDHCHRAAFIRDGQLIATQTIEPEENRAKIICVFGSALPLDELAYFGAKVLAKSDSQARLLYPGDIKALLPILASVGVANFTISPIGLEDKFFLLSEGGNKL